MEAVIFLSIIIALFSILVSCFAIRRVKKQIAEITDALIDVKNGNGNRRILSATNELVAPLAYEINEIVVSYESRLSTVRQTEETNRQLMTSLSHDVRTPLTTLIGYLDAAHKGIVTGKDRDDYIETARRKAHDLKEYIDVLFDWFKLNSNEFAMDINIVEAAELTRNILIDWMLFIFSVAFCLISTLSVALFCKLFHVGMVYGMTYKIFMSLIFGVLIVAASLPIVFLIIYFNKSFLLSILLAFFYSIFNWGILGTIGTSISAAKIAFLNSFPVICVMNWTSGLMMDNLQKDNLLPEAYAIVPTTFHTIFIMAITVVLSLWLIIRFYKKWTR